MDAKVIFQIIIAILIMALAIYGVRHLAFIDPMFVNIIIVLIVLLCCFWIGRAAGLF